MRGSDSFTEVLFSMRRLDDFVPANHPLRRIRVMVMAAASIWPRLATACQGEFKCRAGCELGSALAPNENLG